MSTESTDVLPYLESERHFRLYESYLFRIVQAWPGVIVFEPKPPHASVETLSTRIRMASKSLRDHQWPSGIPMAKFLLMCDEFVVSTKTVPGRVACGPREALLKRNREVVPSVLDEKAELQQIPVINLVDPDDKTILWVFQGHDFRFLISPSHIQTTKDLHALAAGFDVAVQKEDEGKWIIV